MGNRTKVNRTAKSTYCICCFEKRSEQITLGRIQDARIRSKIPAVPGVRRGLERPLPVRLREKKLVRRSFHGRNSPPGLITPLKGLSFVAVAPYRKSGHRDQRQNAFSKRFPSDRYSYAGISCLSTTKFKKFVQAEARMSLDKSLYLVSASSLMHPLQGGLEGRVTDFAKSSQIQHVRRFSFYFWMVFPIAGGSEPITPAPSRTE
jgi:hypothetical protein